MDKISAVLSRFPQHAYHENNINDGNKTSLYKLLESIVEEFNITMSNIDKLSGMIDINTTLPEDLYSRWGALLNIKQNKDETDEQYRDRLKVSITSLSGGTMEAIRYAVACGLGINNDQAAMDLIKVYDAWEYEGEASVSKDYGYVVCDINLNQGSYSTNMEKIVADSANNVKAAGVIVQFVYHNFRVEYYSELDNITYASLSTFLYNKVGE